MIDLSVLNPQQRAAVEQTEGPLLILAGAGSGKTRVLTYRVARLMEKGVAPWHILAITFTNKAAREMAERVHALAGMESQEAWISTFHACCARILRRDIEKLGYKRHFAIYDEGDTQSVIKSVLKALNLSEKEYPPKALRGIISEAKNRMLTPMEWLRETDGDHRSQNLYEVYRAYEAALRGNNALDFDDLLIKTLELLTEQPPVLQYYRDRFRYILVDEYQDTNACQYELVRLLAGEHHNLCVVGDDDQSIYGWRGANPNNILDFERDFPECVTIKLEQNYRSTGNILDAANQVIAHNSGRKEKVLWTEADTGERIALFRAMDERDEASFIVRMSQKLMRQGTNPGNIAVLYRANAQSRVLEETFVRAGVPSRVYGGQRFYERKEVKDILGYLRALVNPDDDVSVRRIINEPRRGIGDATVEKVAAYAEENDMPFLSAVLDWEDLPLSPRPKKTLGEFAELMIDLTEKMYEMKPTALVQEIIDRTGYVKALEASGDEESASRIENIKELQGAISEFEAHNPDADLSAFLENVALVSDLDTMNENGGAVTLMTMHSAKGLEFDIVFMSGMEESVFPINRAIFDERQMEEERRLCYVGITRARRRLFLTCAYTRALYNTRNSNAVSRFVDEIPRRLIDEASQRTGVRRVPPPSRTQWGTHAPGPGGIRGAGDVRGRTPAPSPTGVKLNIPGVNKGFGPVPARSISLFHAGDRIRHRNFGLGTVLAVEGAGQSQKVSIRFDDGSEKTIYSTSSPFVKVDE